MEIKEILLETLFNAEFTTRELLETHPPVLLFTAHTLERMELEFAEELHHLLPPLKVLEFKSQSLFSLSLPWSLLSFSKRTFLAVMPYFMKE